MSAAPPPKQIRFVHNQGQPPSKRRRINAARDSKVAPVESRNPPTKPSPSRKLADMHPPEFIRLSSTQNEASNERHAGQSAGPRPNAPSSEDIRSNASRSPILHHKGKPASHRVPYFRYFGPTAIVPGYKQMVVSVRERRRSTAGSTSAASPSSAGAAAAAAQGGLSIDSVALADAEVTAEALPAYNINDDEPVPPLILHLVKIFFVHLGCNFPFLQEERFTRMVEGKEVEAILVDAVCALSARFSDHPQIARDGKLPRSDYGVQYAQRAKAATVDTFPAPSVGAVQALLMMAYEGFGANQDSALWMYLGLAIRMAVDLGLQKVVGVKYQGEKDPWYLRHWSRQSIESSEAADDEASVSRAQQLEVEQERMDTFWAVFMLDREISSGTGRPVTFRDDDFEFDLPAPTIHPASGWPAPYPTLTRIIHLYGRVSDVLNNIHHAKDLTQDKWAKLAHMESELTKLYQNQDPRLHFNVSNFKAYLKANQGTTFILVHFWFHALIIILHQPTLLTPFGSLNRSHQLLPNSRELSMSSAKTIADILSFAELIGPTSFIGNPFTSQPMYIAACAFLMESMAYTSQPPSRATSPPEGNRPRGKPNDSARISAKHSLLASAANQNYLRCHNSLQQLCAYWGGVKYILTALDQKSKGIWDCETYTNEEYESTKGTRHGSLDPFSGLEGLGSPSAPPFAWSLTGTTNSPNSSLTLMYQNMQANAAAQPHVSSAPTSHHALAQNSRSTSSGHMYDPIRQSMPEAPPSSLYAPSYRQAAKAAPQHQQQTAHPSYGASSQQTSDYDGSLLTGTTPGSGHHASASMYDSAYTERDYSYFGHHSMNPIGDVVTYENPVDIGSLGLPGDMMPQWLEYLPGDVLGGYFDGGHDMNGGTDLEGGGHHG
ncbi:pathway-specific nitrogen regulator [Verticillium alfalfae VaMs.102]|uniref:Pathway-specific nitrogen regulator n=1 Tax=Verticillium alfalfae (strain VaMs.102 / ATCC MYA-4576 / FGSC 10136) TaxID=526221 RepID=C9SJP8_VERA1|nr:pathway-specific nitrogen regulator [Verticillium alfalfae VaMs.102]EEY19662.1 pathway-specific nitrogen regulator [Verticillium alfalfae VaMs.102]